MLKNLENNRTEEIGFVTPTPGGSTTKRVCDFKLQCVFYILCLKPQSTKQKSDWKNNTIYLSYDIVYLMKLQDKRNITSSYILSDTFVEHNCYIPVASFTKKVNSRLATRPLIFNGHLANRGLTSLAKEATGVVLQTLWLVEKTWCQ